MKINEIFEGIQGEGRYAGYPVLFIRTSGCNRKCEFCDTQHEKFVDMSYEKIISQIRKSKCDIVVWTGGEPLLQIDKITDIIALTLDKLHHLESNGDLLDVESIKEIFQYVAISPKDKKTANLFSNFYNRYFDIKVVTDLKMNKELIPYATMLMPLTTNNEEKNKQIRKDVWNYCIINKIKYSPRLHYEVWGHKKGK